MSNYFQVLPPEINVKSLDKGEHDLSPVGSLRPGDHVYANDGTHLEYLGRSLQRKCLVFEDSSGEPCYISFKLFAHLLVNGFIHLELVTEG